MTTVDLKPKDLLLSLPAARDRVYVRRYQKKSSGTARRRHPRVGDEPAESGCSWTQMS